MNIDDDDNVFLPTRIGDKKGKLLKRKRGQQLEGA
jgi:hypothetical protein